MNPPIQNSESRWPTLFKGVALALPALVIWVFTCVLVVPKLKEICAASDTAFPAPIVTALTVSELVKNHLVIGLVVILPVIVLLEWRSFWWGRWRRVIVRTAAYLLNLAVLAILTVLCVMAVMAGANLLDAK